MLKTFHTTLSGCAKLFRVDISKLTQRYNSVYQRRLKSRGKRDAVNFMRSLLVAGERYALHQPISPLPWTASDRDCFPECLAPFKRYLRSSNNFDKIFALSVLRSVEILRLPISRDLSSVTDPPVYSEELVRSISNFIPKIKWLKPLNLKSLKYHFTMKNGPNGPALKSSDSDVAGLVESRHLYDAIQVVQEKLGGAYPMSETFRKSSKGIHSKITQFPEKSGKTRTIAVIDYYSQRALKPLHEAMMQLLKSLRSDGTYSHRNVGMFAKDLTLKRSYTFCADLSSATDRFPAILQKKILQQIVPDTDLCNAFWTLLTERTFNVAWSNESVQYAVGQPMGAYSSWPLFALAHHATLEFCDNSKGVKHKYRMIGDDSITSSEVQSQRYREVISSLGVEINYSKTVESSKGSQYAAAEVAKQLFLNGDNLTPLTPGFIRDLVKPHMFNMCLVELRERYEPLPVLPAALLKSLFPREKIFKRVWCLASNPWNGGIKPSDEGYETHSPWFGVDPIMFRTVFMNLRITTIAGKAEILFTELLDSDEYGFQDRLQHDELHRNEAQLHVEEEIRAQLSQAMLELNDLMFIDDIEDIPELLPVEYITDPRDQYKSRKECRAFAQTTMIEMVAEELAMPTFYGH